MNSGKYFPGFPGNGKKIPWKNSCQNGTGSRDRNTWMHIYRKFGTLWETHGHEMEKLQGPTCETYQIPYSVKHVLTECSYSREFSIKTDPA